jgi:hypothetical protein
MSWRPRCRSGGGREQLLKKNIAADGLSTLEKQKDNDSGLEDWALRLPASKTLRSKLGPR